MDVPRCTPKLFHRGHFDACLIRAETLLEQSDLKWTYAQALSFMKAVCSGLGRHTDGTLPSPRRVEVLEVGEVLPWREKKRKLAI